MGSTTKTLEEVRAYWKEADKRLKANLKKVNEFVTRGYVRHDLGLPPKDKICISTTEKE